MAPLPGHTFFFFFIIVINLISEKRKCHGRKIKKKQVEEE